MTALQWGRLLIAVMVASQVGLGCVEMLRGQYRAAVVALMAGVINYLIYLAMMEGI